MRINYDYEPEIILKDLFFDVLYRWRSILVAALIGAVLLAGVQHFTGKGGGTPADDEQYKLELEEYKANVAMYESRITAYQGMIQDIEEYMANSVYYNLSTATLRSEVRSYLVRLKQDDRLFQVTPPQDPANDLMALYAYTLKDDLDTDKLAEILGTGERAYIDELVEIKVNNESNTMELTVRGGSDEAVARASEYFDDRLRNVCAEKLQSVYPHELMSVNDRKNLRDQELLLVDAQQKQLQNLTKYQTAVTDADKALKKLTKPKKPKTADNQMGKMAGIGCVLFALLMVVFHVVRYLARERLRDGVEMTRRYGLLVVEEADHSRARRPGKGIDGLIERWEFGRVRKDAAQAGRQAAALLGPRLPGSATLVLLSTRPEAKLQPLRDALAQGLNAWNTQVVCAADCLHEDRMSKLPDGARLLVVEEKDESQIAQINREAELVAMLGMNADGAILI